MAGGVTARTVLVFAAVAGFGARPAAAAERPPELAKAVATYEATKKRLTEGMVQNFDLALDRVSKSSQNVNLRIKLTESLTTEKERFEKHGFVPWSEPMRAYQVAYVKSLLAAQTELQRVYTVAIDKALRAKAAEQVAQLNADLETVLAPKPIAVWKHILPNRTFDMKLFVNGRRDSPASRNQWSFANGTITFRTVDQKQPGGYWVESLPVAPDGRTYGGKNANGTVIRGEYTPPE